MWFKVLSLVLRRGLLADRSFVLYSSLHSSYCQRQCLPAGLQRSPVSPPAAFFGWFIGFVYRLLSNIMVCSRFVFIAHRFEYYSFFGAAFVSLCGVGYCARVPLISNHSNHFGPLLRLLIRFLGVGRGLALAMRCLRPVLRKLCSRVVH